MNLDDDDDDMSGRPAVRRLKETSERRPDAMTLLPAVMLEHALGKAGMARLSGSRSFCLIVETRSDDWVVPVERYLTNAGDWDQTVAKTTADARRRDEVTGPAVLRTLAQGGRVAGVATRSGFLPDAMATAADIHVELPKVTAEIVETVIRRMTRRRVTVPPAVANLAFGDLVACLRSGDGPKAILRRLERAVASVKTITPVPYDVPHIRDLHGYGAAKDWAIELVEDVEAWRRGDIEFSAIASRNAVLVSSPGLGKSTFAKSLAKSLQVPFVATSVGQWFANGPGNLDSVIKQIDLAFATASAAAPAVLLLDEIDAVPNRATIDSRGADWWLPVITHLLTTLDSAVSGAADKLFVIGATNHGEKLDSALVRPGRLDRMIYIDHPDAEALAAIMRQHLGADLAGEDLSDAANLAFGATGAHVVSWVRSARRAARTAKRPMQMADLLAVIAPADNRAPELMERVAIHEAGHAVAAHATGLGAVLSVSIVVSGNAGGLTVIDFDGHTPTRASIDQTVTQMLAGRAAEEVLLGEPGTGAGGAANSDLARATQSLGLKHLGTGLGEHMTFFADAKSVPSVLAINERAARAVETDLRRLYARALEIMRENVTLVRAVADTLLERRHLGPAGFLEIVDRTKPEGKEPTNG